MYDIRRGAMMQQHAQSHPLSTICLSPCGQYCATGNLKGEVMTFDFRNLQQPLCERRIHYHAVVRVAFISDSDSHSLSGHSMHATSIESAKSKTGDSLSIGAAASPFGSGLHEASPYCKDANTSIDRNNSWASLLQFRAQNTSMNDSMMRRLSVESCANVTGVGLGIQPSVIREETNEEIHEEHSFAAPSNEAPPKIAASEPVPKRTRTVDTESNVPIMNAQKTAELAEYFEEQIIKNETKKVLEESVAYKALSGCEELQNTYADSMESLFRTMRTSRSEYEEIFDFIAQDDPIIGTILKNFEGCVEEAGNETLNMFNSLGAELEFLERFSRLI